MAERLYFRQLLSGRDFAVGDPMATQMVNFAYVIGDRERGEAVLVDPAYNVADLVAAAERDGLRIVGALGTHYHADHVGGSIMQYELEGIRELLELRQVPVHVHRGDAEFVRKTTGVGPTDLVSHDGGDRLLVGGIEVELVHTPGHTPGSQCFLVDGRLVAGDTLFLDGCGRTDLPGSDPEAMYDSLTRLASLPDEVVVYPGHRYSPASSGTMAAVKESNYVFKPRTKDAWLTMFGA
ncbi:MAG TPA: MBL fold metallo-hydrolase [Acidimicrobiales bacterium]|nr:MBL fold metallo-hydrolase [Acidimicrobiales bacterium]